MFETRTNTGINSLRDALLPKPDPRFYTPATTYANRRAKSGRTSIAGFQHDDARAGTPTSPNGTHGPPRRTARPHLLPPGFSPATS